MKKGFKFRAIILVLALMLATSSAMAEIMFEGKVAAGTAIPVLAPYGGQLEKLAVSAGDRIITGYEVAHIKATSVYAPVEGVVRGVFGEPGDATEDVTERYGAVLYIEPTNKYTISASTEKAYDASENKFVHIGEVVYISCTADGVHQGTGRVIAVADEGKYTVEVTSGEFSIGENVGVYREKGYPAASRIGRGTVAATKAVAVKGTGSILNMRAQNGAQVKRGEVLFDTVKGALDGLIAPGSQIISPVTGIVATVDVANGADVEKNAKIATLFADDELTIQVSVAESDLSYFYVGMPVAIEFGWDPEQETRAPGRVTRISYLNASETGEAHYVATVNFKPDDTVRIGMSVIVYPVSEDETDIFDSKTDVKPDEVMDDSALTDTPDTQVEGATE